MRWTEDAPTHCPDGHELGPDRVLVGWVAELGPDRVLVGWVAARAGTLEGGTRVHECRQCGAVIRWKPNSRWK
ncbi:hypothetical protein GJR88_02267 [Dietzia sp. DQ12-45-1b]|nr:hypothetical protein GJR88_02267 [Dietzia sp. DQ12-45-1b]